MFFMRKLTAILLASLLILTPLAANAATPFADVPAAHFASEAVAWASAPANGAFMIGDAGGNFNPSANVNRFEAAQIFALAAGFRLITTGVDEQLVAEFDRSREMWQPFLQTQAAQSTRWNSMMDREVAFLLYRGVLTTPDVQNFVVQVGNQEQVGLLTRQEAVAWMVRLIGRGSAAAAVTLPPPAPFRDDAAIGAAFRRYVYYAKSAQLISAATGYFNPAANITRAELAQMFFNTLANRPLQEPEPLPAPDIQTPAGNATIIGTVASIFHDGRIGITSAQGTENFAVTTNVMVSIDGTQRGVAQLLPGMQAMVLINAQRQILSIVARSTTGPGTPSDPSLTSDEGFITAISLPNITIRTQRVRIGGQVIDEERTFALSPSAAITRGGTAVFPAAIEIGDIAFFDFAGSTIYGLQLMEQNRTLEGTLREVRVAYPAGTATLILDTESGNTYELRITPGTQFARGTAHNLSWSDLRRGDAIVADVEFDRLVTVHATGIRSTVDGVLTQLLITEASAQITILRTDGIAMSYYVLPAMFDVYTLRIGMQLRLQLDSREVINATEMGGTAAVTSFTGVIQSINAANRTITVREGTGNAVRTHTVQIPAAVTITQGTNTIAFAALRMNMQVHITLTAAGSGTAATVTILQ
jgi:hypothetical protein